MEKKWADSVSNKKLRWIEEKPYASHSKKKNKLNWTHRRRDCLHSVFERKTDVEERGKRSWDTCKWRQWHRRESTSWGPLRIELPRNCITSEIQYNERKGYYITIL